MGTAALGCPAERRSVDFSLPAGSRPFFGSELQISNSRNIPDPNFQNPSRVKYLVGTLDKFKVSEKEMTEVLTAIGGLKAGLVGRPRAPNTRGG